MSTPVVLITGALTGIGRAAAFAFAREGNRVVVSGRHEDVGQALAAELREFGGKAEFIRADVRREDDVRSLIDQTVACFGRLDAAVNSAGSEGKPGPVAEQTADSYAATFDTNVLGTLLSMKHELRVMLGQHSGSIVNISSTYGHAGTPTPPSMPPASTRSRGSPHPPRSRSQVRAFASMRWRRGRRRPECSTALPATPRERPASSRPCRSAASASPTKSPTPFCSFAPTKRPLLLATSFPSMAGSRRNRQHRPIASHETRRSE
jgi:NAD(P)-dependent dehydrogenase (short-subunit alcohol dehydrogenase family)